MNLLDILVERGFIEDIVHKEALIEYLSTKGVTGYIGFDPTASSLHIGSLVPIMSLVHMQRAGLKPVVLVGGGTGMIGDPSGKTEMRQLIHTETLEQNKIGIANQLKRFIDFHNDQAIFVDNATWLNDLKYIPFLREIGRHFNVNRMLKAESYKKRLDSDDGLSFIEFNYMLLQAFDFLTLHDTYGCKLQMGGSDQMGNIIAGIELIRKLRQTTAFGITFPLITTSSGAKMGKTASGAVWLDENKTTPYDYYQYWINTDDRDVKRFLALFTLLPMPEINSINADDEMMINSAKKILAFETTRLAHGEIEAVNSYLAAARMFGEKTIPLDLLPSSTIRIALENQEVTDATPTTEIDSQLISKGIPFYILFEMTELTKSRGEAKRLVKQGGVYINGKRIESEEYIISNTDIKSGEIMLRSGKKRYHRIIVTN
ncbi:MAG: tyrosine--tRNA ligase [Desulfobacterales bacterium]|nr:tyrosine--tRNA ligase [Desulfobacterales bacterium]